MHAELQNKFPGVLFEENLIFEALTHPSYSNERGCQGYQRLEHLGDAILYACVTELLFKQYPDANPYELHKHRISLVCGPTLTKIAIDFNFGVMIRFGSVDKHNNLSKNSSILADVVESIIGVAFLAGGYDNAKKLIEIMIKSINS